MKKKIMFVTVAAVIIALAVTGTALAGNGFGTGIGEPVETADGTGFSRSDARGTGQRFALQAELYETEEEFHDAVLARKLAIIEARVADGSLLEDDAATIINHLTACDGSCETEGDNPDRPEDGWGIFGRSGQESQAVRSGARGNGSHVSRMKGQGIRSENCELDDPLQDGSGKPE